MPSATKTRTSEAMLRAARDALNISEARETVPAEPYPVVRPRDVLPHPRKIDCMVAWDTEASGLYVDDGARVAVVSVAYSLKDDPDEIVAYAFPFDQGLAEDKGLSVQKNAKGEVKANLFLADPKRVEAPLVTWDGVHVPPGFIAKTVRGRTFLQLDRVSWTRDVNLGSEDWADMMRWLKLAGEWCGLDAHNAKYDLLLTHAGTRKQAGVDLEEYLAWDSMLACKELWPLESIALKNTAARLWGSAEADEAQEVRDALLVAKKLYGLSGDDSTRYDLLPWDVIGPYATQDARLALRLTKLQVMMLWEGEGNWQSFDRNMDLVRTLYRLESRGFGPFDMERADEVARAIEARIAHLENAMPFDPPTAYKAKEYFFDDLGLKPWKGAEEPRVIETYTNKQGKISKKVVKQGSLSVDVCNRMAKQDVPFAAEFGELLRLQTANRMNYRGYYNLAGPDHRIRTSFKQAFVRSGRMSVERFQAQAIPRRDSIKIADIPGYGKPPHPRDLFLTPPGRKRVTIDLSQAELRVAFQYSGCKLGIEQIRAGRDIHGEMATQIFGVRRGEGDPKDCYCETCAEFSHYRYISKRGVFGGIFMVGPKTFQETIWKLAQLDLPFSVCKKTVHGFRDMYPEIEVAYNDSQNFVMQNGYVELVGGERSYFGGRDYDNTAWNRRVQGSLGIFNAHWLIEVERRTQDLAPGGCLLLSVHDSVTLDLPEDCAEEVVADIQAWTNNEFEEWFGIVGGTDAEWGY